MKYKIRLIYEFAFFFALAGAFGYYFQQDPSPTSPSASSVAQGDETPQPHSSAIDTHSGAQRLAHSQRERVTEGFTLVPEVGSGLVRLINMSGSTVHTWNMDADRARLLPNGHLAVLHGSKWGLTVQPWRDLQNVIREYDWDGNLVWEFALPGRIHHDLTPLPNGNFLSLHRIDLPVEYSATLTNPRLQGLQLRSDEIFEVNRNKEIIWSWKAHEHLDPNSCGKYPCPKKLRKSIKNGKKPFDWTHTNTTSILPENKWYDQGDKRFKPGNILTVIRNMSTVFLIDRESGDVVWSYTGDYRGGLQYAHEAQMIEKGLPGAGNILIFDNGTERLESLVLEIDPTTEQLIWVYDVGNKFYSRVQGAMQRFPNGNTLISEDMGPRIFEVTPTKETVWTYHGNTLRIARAKRYFPDYCEEFKELKLWDTE
ncbi:MAG: aryl-sulfate sulfotransferase [Bdellovibrionales bacterium]|nr:aryl-sulfate sulfotransferase [Bdellovibrionales bacterium]